MLLCNELLEFSRHSTTSSDVVCVSGGVATGNGFDGKPPELLKEVDTRNVMRRVHAISFAPINDPIAEAAASLRMAVRHH